MASDITLRTLATATTSTLVEQIGNVAVAPREVDTEGTEASVDLGDDLSVSVELAASHDAANYREAQLECWLECSSNDVDGWREVARFDRFNAYSGASVRQRVSFVSDRYLRCRWAIRRTTVDKGGVSFSVTGRAVGAAA